MKKLLAISLAFLSLGLSPKLAKADTASPPVTTQARNINWTYVELLAQLQDPRVPRMKYWEAIAQCETGTNWKNRGR